MAPISEPDFSYTPIAPSRVLQTPRPSGRPDSGPDIDFGRRVVDNRRARRGGDGWYRPGEPEVILMLIHIKPISFPTSLNSEPRLHLRR